MTLALATAHELGRSMQPNPYPPQYQPAPPANFIPPQYPAQQAGYPTQQQQYGAPAAPDNGDPFGDPSRGGTLAPRPRHLVGRTVIFECLRVDENSKFEGQTRPVAYAHMTVVDGGRIEFGDEIKSGRQTRPNTHSIDAPARFANVMISNTWIVNAIRDELPPLKRGLLLGVIVEGKQGNHPYLLTKVTADENGNERPDGEARRAAALNLWRAHESGQWQSPVPQPLAPAGPPPGAVNYGYAQQTANMGYNAGQGFAYGQGQYVPQQYAQPQSAPQQYPAQYPTGAMVEQQAMQPYSAPPAQQQPAPSMLGVPGAAFDVNTPPPGWDAAVWNGFTPDQRAAVWARQQQQPAPSGQPQPTGF